MATQTQKFALATLHTPLGILEVAGTLAALAETFNGHKVIVETQYGSGITVYAVAEVEVDEPSFTTKNEPTV